MFGILRDTIHTARLKARYRRLVQERVLELVEVTAPQAVAPDPGNWMALGDTSSAPNESTRVDQRAKARSLSC